MSRARPVGGLWFDRQKANEKATVEQLELLSATENVSLDDLLDEGLRQGEIIERLRAALGETLVPQEVLERRRIAKENAKRQPACRICSSFGWDCEGSITRHHFIPRWMMLNLENYQSYAARAKCTIPICIGRHRDLHLRGDTDTPKSMAQFLTDDERKFAQKLLDELREQHPAIFDLVAGGDESTYESVLIRDYISGAFRKASDHAVSAGQTMGVAATG
jgi:hypothetical protein